MRLNPDPGTALSSLVILASFAAIARAGMIPDGYWKLRDAKDYEEYVRIEGDAGFLCILDDKSSFPFAIVGDSITTPWNRKDALVWFPGSGDIAISGEEKDEPYSTRYQVTDSATYAAKCADEETQSPLALKPRPSRTRAPSAASPSQRDALGRKLDRPQRPRGSGTPLRFPSSPRT